MSKRKLAAIAAAAVMACGMCFSGAYAVSTPFNNTALEASAYSRNTEGFVTRMYDVVLGRKPDAAGLKSWTSQLNSGKKTAADIVDGFFFSDEYKGKKKSADNMVTDCYKAMLDRSPDAKGKADWKRRLDIGMTIQAVCKGFVGSNEFKGLCSTYGIKPGTITPRLAKDDNYERTYFVYRLYKNCLGRNPDGAGLENWCRSIKCGLTGAKAAQGFVFSSEYMNKLNAKTGDDYTHSYVDMLYRTILGRSPDENGLKSWTLQMFSKSPESIFNGFIFSNEFKGQCAKAGISVGTKIAVPEDMSLEGFPEKIVACINKERSAKGLSEIRLDNALSQATQQYADELEAGHDTSTFCVSAHLRDVGIIDYSGLFDYSCPYTMRIVSTLYNSGSKYVYLSPDTVVKTLMAYDDDKKAMFNPAFRRVGIAHYNCDDNDVRWCLFYLE